MFKGGRHVLVAYFMKQGLATTNIAMAALSLRGLRPAQTNFAPLLTSRFRSWQCAIAGKSVWAETGGKSSSAGKTSRPKGTLPCFADDLRWLRDDGYDRGFVDTFV